jgi:thiamine biosynthesis protein ThiI
MAVVVAGYADLSVKSSSVRQRMIDQLAEVIRWRLQQQGTPAELTAGFDRLLITTSEPAAVMTVASTTPGIAHVLEAEAVPATLEAICAGAAELAAAHPTSHSFAVSVHRGDVPPDVPPSQQLKEVVGAKIQAVTGAAVDLDAADRRYHIDLRGETAYIGTDRRGGVRGLPPGVQDPVVVLVSGGIDSPVAMWHLLRRGVPVIPVHCSLGPQGEPEATMRAEVCIQRLNERVGPVARPMRTIDLEPVVSLLRAETGALRMIHLHRALLRSAAMVAAAADAVGIATGEAVGQKASQTSRNLAVIDAAVDIAVYRPLVAMDKPEIVAQARSLGTFAPAIAPTACEAIAPSHPETAATLEMVIDDEPEPLASTLRDCLESVT